MNSVDVVDGLLDEMDVNSLAVLMHERKRKREHANVKISQPDIHVGISDEHWIALLDNFRKPILESERATGTGLDYLIQTTIDCMAVGHREDTLFSALRVVRWVLAHQPHLLTIDGVILWPTE